MTIFVLGLFTWVASRAGFKIHDKTQLPFLQREGRKMQQQQQQQNILQTPLILNDSVENQTSGIWKQIVSLFYKRQGSKDGHRSR